jgi:hypothetical protein
MRAITGILRSYAAGQVAGLRDVASGLVYLMLAAGVLLVAMAFAFLAIFWAMATALPHWQAALVVAGAALITAVILRILGLRLIRRRMPFKQLIGLGQPVLAPRSMAQSPDGLSLANPVTLILAAAVAGLIIGRRVSK